MSISRNPNKPESISPERMEYANRQIVPSKVIRDPRVQTAIDFMNSNISRRITLPGLARVAKMSTPHFSRVFKAETKLPPKEYLRRLRLEKARYLLATTMTSIKEVMLSVGYNDPSTFAPHFKRYFGLTPTEYKSAVH